MRRPSFSEVKLPIRWTVKRTFDWLAMIQSMLHRLEPSDLDPDFRSPWPVAA